LTYLIDKNGKIRARFQGEVDPKKIENLLKPLLVQP
jgi:glutathione peroxidase-family protein